MGHDTFYPTFATREEKRQANEALGRSFCKTLAELITNSDSSGKRKFNLPHSSGLVDLMFQVPKGHQLDTAALKLKLPRRAAMRLIDIRVVGASARGRKRKEITVIDEAQGMSAEELKTALEDIGGDRREMAGGMVGRNLFGRGLSDVMRAHEIPEIQTFNGKQLSFAYGAREPRWAIERKWIDSPKSADFENSLLSPTTTGTAIRFLGSNEKFRIPDPTYIVSRLANFYMLRLIAADPNVDLELTQYRATATTQERIQYDFPVGQVIESFETTFTPSNDIDPLKVEFLLARSERKLEGPAQDRDTRENGLLIIDELDAVYDLTFVDPEYEKAEFLRHIFGIIRIHGLRAVLDAHLNAKDPSSPLRVDRDGFNRDHEFSREMLDFLAGELRPYFERERKRLEDRDQNKMSEVTRKRIDDALKQLNKYFQQITEKTGPGDGGTDGEPDEPTNPIAFFPDHVRLVIGRPKRVLLLVRDDLVTDGLRWTPKTGQDDKV